MTGGPRRRAELKRAQSAAWRLQSKLGTAQTAERAGNGETRLRDFTEGFRDATAGIYGNRKPGECPADPERAAAWRRGHSAATDLHREMEAAATAKMKEQPRC
ncbi:hypothetical protein [Nisaea sediminum]|uniref:hypothetical protein n=1 Tax=Nisaea sediminum TaxID=2775867 RepID=UPI001866A9B8|nr:hypothetical protein [Nisaea sediminum]